jgi:Phosphoenolpyruvate phosphomutase
MHKQGLAVLCHIRGFVQSVEMTQRYLRPPVGGRFLVGEFEDDQNRPYFLVVNKDLKNSFQFRVHLETIRESPRSVCGHEVKSGSRSRVNSMSATNQEKAARFCALHDGAGAFVIPNPWDVASTRILDGLDFEALATSSAASTCAMGRRDGGLTRDEADLPGLILSPSIHVHRRRAHLIALPLRAPS